MNYLQDKVLYGFSLLLLCFITFPTEAHPSNQSPRQKLSLSKEQALKAREFTLRRFISQNPRVAEAHLNLGNIYWQQGRDGKPIKHYLAAIKLKPDYAEAYYNLGNVFFIQGEHEQAVKAYTKSVSIKPSFAPAHNGLGNALLDEGNYQKAIISYQKALKINPRYLEASYNLCTANIYAANYYQAINSCLNSIDLSPDSRTYNNLGNAYFRTKQFDFAEDAYTKALKIDPRLPEAHFNLAAISLVHGKNKEKAITRQKILEIIDPQKSHKLAALIKSVNF